jgi:hypothetical protein
MNDKSEVHPVMSQILDPCYHAAFSYASKRGAKPSFCFAGLETGSHTQPDTYEAMLLFWTQVSGDSIGEVRIVENMHVRKVRAFSYKTSLNLKVLPSSPASPTTRLI